MFFSATQYHSYINHPHNSEDRRATRAILNRDDYREYAYSTAEFTFNEAKKSLREIKRRIANRDGVDNRLFKWLRPWEVVPSLANFKAPVGDYAIGVEVEKGFRNKAAVIKIANVIKDWKYITLDNEGGNYPLEVTFPPVLLSKFSKRSQAARYMAVLQEHKDLIETDLINVGCHINVSKGGVSCYSEFVVEEISDIIRDLYWEDNYKYFGRNPYGYIYDQGKYLEFKLFNTTEDYATLKRYINIAVALTDLVCDTDKWYSMQEREQKKAVHAALELGYNKR